MSPQRIEQWMERLRERKVHVGTSCRVVRWGPRTWNAYRTLGIRLFNWARHRKRKFTTENPFLLIDKQKGEGHRETRITVEQQEKLLEVASEWAEAKRKSSDAPNKSLQRLGREMHRRLLAAFDTGLRSGEMGLRLVVTKSSG